MIRSVALITMASAALPERDIKQPSCNMKNEKGMKDDEFQSLTNKKMVDVTQICQDDYTLTPAIWWVREQIIDKYSKMELPNAEFPTSWEMKMQCDGNNKKFFIGDVEYTDMSKPFKRFTRNGGSLCVKKNVLRFQLKKNVKALQTAINKKSDPAPQWSKWLNQFKAILEVTRGKIDTQKFFDSRFEKFLKDIIFEEILPIYRAASMKLAAAKEELKKAKKLEAASADIKAAQAKVEAAEANFDHVNNTFIKIATEHQRLHRKLEE